MQIDHAARASGLVQAVDILGHQLGNLSDRLPRGQRAMAGIRRGLPEAWPADQAARPVAAPGMGVLQEIAVLHRRRPLPRPVLVAVFGDPGTGADAGAGQHEQARVGGEEARELVDLGGVRHGSGTCNESTSW